MGEQDIEKSEEPIMVSVCCLVYNHEPFLRECFDGFVMQKTNFPIEILVHDDASTDHSADIIREYTAKYPHLFKPIYQTENQYSKGVNVFTEILNRLKGKYIAVCEGDDYWTDPLKLQKQVDFMEVHNDYVLCFHNARNLYVEKQKMKNYQLMRLPRGYCRDFSSLDLMLGITPPTCTVMYRNKLLKDCIKIIILKKKIVNGDTVISSLLGKYGKGKYMAIIADSVCRIHNGGVWQLKNELDKSKDLYVTFTFLQHAHTNKVVSKLLRRHRLRLCAKILQIPALISDFKIFLLYYFRMVGLSLISCDIKTFYKTHKGIIYNFIHKNENFGIFS